MELKDMRLGDRLRALRKQKGLKQRQLGDLAGASQAVIQKIENNKSIRPRCLDKLAKALDVTPAFLMYGEGDGAINRSEVSKEGLILAKKWDSLATRSKLKVVELVNQLTLKG